MSIRFNSRDEWFRYPFGAVKCNTEVTFRIVAEGNPFAVFLIIGGEKILMKADEYDSFMCGYTVPLHGCILMYHFEIIYETAVIFGKGRGGFAEEGSEEEFQLTVYEERYIPEWVKKSVCYQIFPDRFNRAGYTPFKCGTYIYENWDDEPNYRRGANGEILQWDFFGGNFNGIKNKLGYLNDLGINMIYLNPIFSAKSNHRYDTSDYMKVDSLLGTEDDFKKMVCSAKKYGIKIILDGVFNHTGSDSIYFDIENRHGGGAYNNESSKYRSWYNFKDDKNYDCWWGIGDLPSVNELDSGYVKYIVTGENSVIKKWNSYGISGWRLDVADELPDEFIKILRKEYRKINPDGYILGEVWEDATNKIAYNKLRNYFTGDELDGVMNYPFRSAVIAFEKNEITSFELADILLELAENYPFENMLACLTVIGTHDTERLLTVLNKNINAVKRVSALQMIYTGVPCVYYGDEADSEGGKDPHNRRTYPWAKENNELVEWYKKIIGIRKKYNVLSSGRAWFGSVGKDVFYIKRFDNKSMFYVFVNRSGEKVFTGWNEELTELESGETIRGSFSVEPYGIVFMKGRI